MDRVRASTRGRREQTTSRTAGPAIASPNMKKELVMKRNIAMGLAILAAAAVVQWKLVSHPDTSASLQDIKLIQHSEHSNPGPTDALAGIRIRLSPSDFNDTDGLTSQVPQIALAAD
jgi:hypothetical protein